MQSPDLPVSFGAVRFPRIVKMPAPMPGASAFRPQANRAKRSPADPSIPLHGRSPRSSEDAAGIRGIEPMPSPSLDTIAGAMFVATCVACWIAVASTATAPLLAAGELLARVGAPER